MGEKYDPFEGYLPAAVCGIPEEEDNDSRRRWLAAGTNCVNHNKIFSPFFPHILGRGIFKCPPFIKYSQFFSSES
jgi:hypothetical protein